VPPGSCLLRVLRTHRLVQPDLAGYQAGPQCRLQEDGQRSVAWASSWTTGCRW